jgi:hypothetical protein
MAHSARVDKPEERRMGSPQYGRLILDDEYMATAGNVEFQSLVWSDDGRYVAAQELESWLDGPRTRVIVIDAERRATIAASPARAGIGNPLRFEPGELVYHHWHHRRGDVELRLPIRS